MSKLYPERLPESVLKDPKRSAERKFYEAAAQLSSKFTVFHSVSYALTQNILMEVFRLPELFWFEILQNGLKVIRDSPDLTVIREGMDREYVLCR